MGVGEQRMRIIAGRLRGRRLAAPRGTLTRPTTDRVREALFSSLTSLTGPDLGGGPVLDGFAGSGALGLEALSRGAAPVVFVERDRSALRVLRGNVAALGVADEVTLVPGDVLSLAGRLQHGPFSLILLDPPYTLDPAVVADLLGRFARAGVVADRAYVTWEHASGVQAVWPEGYQSVASRTHGATTFDIARHTEGEA